tara:strand:- start:1615 stop:2256 length:642 start_codon:yes stop_codon:yes gene_type:complete
MAWPVVVAMLAYSAYKGAKAAEAADDQADKVEASTLLVAKAAEENKAAATKESYGKTLHSKDIISGKISDVRIQSKLSSDEVAAKTAGMGGVLTDTGSTLDVQMAVLNEGRKNEANLLAQMSIQKARNAWEAKEERASIERNSQMEIARLRDNASDIRRQGRDAKKQAYVGGIMNAISSYYGSKKPDKPDTSIADKATSTDPYREGRNPYGYK